MSPQSNGYHDKRRLLKILPIFQGLTPCQLDKVAKSLRKMVVPSDKCLLQQGDPGGSLFILLSGAVEVRRRAHEEAQDHLVATLGPTQAFGEMALVDDAPRVASVLSTTPSVLLVMTREDWEQLLFVDKDIGYHVLWNLVRMLASRLRKVEPEVVPIISMEFM